MNKKAIMEKAWQDAINDIYEEYGFCYDFGLSSCCVFEEYYDNADALYQEVYEDCMKVNAPDESDFED